MKYRWAANCITCTRIHSQPGFKPRTHYLIIHGRSIIHQWHVLFLNGLSAQVAWERRVRLAASSRRQQMRAAAAPSTMIIVVFIVFIWSLMFFSAGDSALIVSLSLSPGRLRPPRLILHSSIIQLLFRLREGKGFICLCDATMGRWIGCIAEKSCTSQRVKNSCTGCRSSSLKIASF